MKKILFLSLIVTMVCFTASAQRVTMVNRNGAENWGANKTTEDSAYHYIDSVALKTNEGGFIEVKVIGYAKDTAYCITGVKKVRFNKRRGTLTLGSVIDELTPVVDAALGTATFDIVAANNKVYIRVKGKDGLNITWCSILRRFTVSYGN